MAACISLIVLALLLSMVVLIVLGVAIESRRESKRIDALLKRSYKSSVLMIRKPGFGYVPADASVRGR